MKTNMKSYELVSTVTAISCAIARCVPKEELSLVAAVFGQIASTLATILEEEAILNPDKPIPVITPDTELLTTPRSSIVP